MAMTTVPARANSEPTTLAGPSRSPRKAAASKALIAGTVAMIRAAVPAGTCVSPQFNSNWYALIPVAPTARTRGRSRRAGRRTFIHGSTATRTAVATASRNSDSSVGP